MEVTRLFSSLGLRCFPSRVFLSVQKCKEEERKKKNLQHRIPQKRYPCNLDNLHILSDPDHQPPSLGYFHLLYLCLPSRFFCLAVHCGGRGGGGLCLSFLLIRQHWRSRTFTSRSSFKNLAGFCFETRRSETKIGLKRKLRKPLENHVPPTHTHTSFYLLILLVIVVKN